MARTATPTSLERITHEMRMVEVEIISMLTPALARASNMAAATPGLDFIPAPTSDTLAMSESATTSAAPTSSCRPRSTSMARLRSALGTVKEMSVVPPWETFWTIMSTFTPCSAMPRITRAAIPGLSGTRTRVTLASEVSCGTPETIAFSIRSSSSRTQVPGTSVKLERTCRTMPVRRAYSTQRSISTLAPQADSSSISSYETMCSLRASGTTRGSAV